MIKDRPDNDIERTYRRRLRRALRSSGLPEVVINSVTDSEAVIITASEDEEFNVKVSQRLPTKTILSIGRIMEKAIQKPVVFDQGSKSYHPIEGVECIE